jgi:hypothetical protein
MTRLVPPGHHEGLRALLDRLAAPKRIRPGGDLYHPAIPPSAADVTRRSREFKRRWGNPYVVGKTVTVDGEAVEVRDRAHAVDLHRRYLRRHPELVDAARRELAGRDLACWCPLPAAGEPDVCHAGVLLRVAAGSEP